MIDCHICVLGFQKCSSIVGQYATTYNHTGIMCINQPTSKATIAITILHSNIVHEGSIKIVVSLPDSPYKSLPRPTFSFEPALCDADNAVF